VKSTSEEYVPPDAANHDYSGEIVEHCERLGIAAIADLKKALHYDPTTYFKNIARRHWLLSDQFIIFLLLIGARPSDFSIELLTKGSWQESIAKMVIEGARKARIG
jgi:hypothetical protein